MGFDLNPKHYYKPYENIEEARRMDCLISDEVTFELVDMDAQLKDQISKSIELYTTKSYYEVFYGFLFKFKGEDKERMRVNIDLKEDSLMADVCDCDLLFNKYFIGHIYGASFECDRNIKDISVDIVKYEDKKETSVGRLHISIE